MAYLGNVPLWDLLVYRVAGLDPGSRLGSGVQFFLADTVKITLLLVGIIFLVTIARSFLSLERTRTLLGGRREGVANLAAAGLGVATPFCSCSAVPERHLPGAEGPAPQRSRCRGQNAVPSGNACAAAKPMVVDQVRPWSIPIATFAAITQPHDGAQINSSGTGRPMNQPRMRTGLRP